MAYDIKQWPRTVYPGEIKTECPEALVMIDVLLQRMREAGPSPPGYACKHLGKKVAALWQINLKIEMRQVRILFAPYGQTIVLFRIHRKSSGAEQDRAYELAAKRKREYDQQHKTSRGPGDRHSTIH